MVNGALGETGDRALIPVVEERVPKNEIVIILPQKMKDQAVTLMDLLMKSPKVVTVELALVHESFYWIYV
jgi:hypothetical protein